jgi:hypothetical protein
MSVPAIAASVAATGLPVTRVTPVPKPLPDEEWDALRTLVIQERICGHLVAAVERDQVARTPEQADQATRAHERALALDLELERLLCRTITSLREHAIEVRVLKGPAVAHLDYANPALRSFGDIDLLVPSASYYDAVGVLVAEGGEPAFAEPRPGFTARFGKGVCVRTSGGLEIDLHRNFVAGPFGLTLDPDELFETPHPFELAGVHMSALGQTDRFLHACYHAALGGREPRLSTLRDVAEIALGDRLDVEAAIAQATRRRSSAVVQRALALTAERLSVQFPSELANWACTYAPSDFERRCLKAYVDPSRSYGSQALAGVRALPTFHDRVAYVREPIRPVRR